LEADCAWARLEQARRLHGERGATGDDAVQIDSAVGSKSRDSSSGVRPDQTS